MIKLHFHLQPAVNGRITPFTKKKWLSYPLPTSIIEDTIRHNILQITSTSKAYIPCPLAITTKYLRETCSLNMPMNDTTGQSKGYAFVSAPKHFVWRVTQTKWSKFSWLSNQNRRGEIHKRATIVISSPAINQPVVVNENLLNQNSLQNLYLRIPSRRLLVCMSLIHCKK